MTFSRPNARTLLSIAAWTLSTSVTLLLFQTALAPTLVPFVLRAFPAALLLFAVVRPADAMLLLAATIPIIATCAGMFRVPFGRDFSEVLVLAWLAGYLVHLARPQGSRDSAGDIALPAGLLATVAATSAAVILGGVALRFEDFGAAFRVLVFERYFTDNLEFRPFIETMLLFESMGLVLAITRLGGGDEAYRRSLARMLVVGTAAAAAWNLSRLAAMALQTGSFLDGLSAYFPATRVHVHYPDINAAGSHFAMVLVLAIGVAAAERRARAAWIGAAVLVAGALWLTHSRSAIVAAVLVVAALWVWSAARHWSTATRRRGIWLAAGTIVLAAGILAALLLHDAPGRKASESLAVRLTIARAGVQMFKEHPVFGVGISQFYNRSADYLPSLFRTIYYPRENAHNNLLQILAELGIVGFAAFAGLVGLAAVRGLRGAPAAPLARWVAGAAAALLLTALGGHPLLTREVAYIFWMMVGLLAAFGSEIRAPRTVRTIVVAMAVLVLASSPLRVRQERRAADLEHVAFGVSKWTPGPLPQRTRSVGRHATIYVPVAAAGLEMPLRSTIAGRESRVIDIRFDGHPAGRITLRGQEWQTVRLVLPRTRGLRYHRMEIFVPDADALPGVGRDNSLDAGVEMGWIRLIGETGAPQ